MTAPAYRIDDQTASAAQFYAAACDPRRSVVVEACAGAGKTWMLVSRILRALLDGAEPQQILAITFTRRAAGEMRERLEEWLLEYSAPRSTQAQRVQALVDRGLDHDQALVMADALGDLHLRLLRSGRSVDVRTFHGWFAQLVSNAPIELVSRLGLAAQMQFIEDTESLRAELFQGFHRAVNDDAALRADYVSLVRQHRRHLVQQWLDAAWQRGGELACADEAGTLQGAVPSAQEVFVECAGLDDPRQLLQREPLRGRLLGLASRLGGIGRVKTQTAAQGLIDALSLTDPAAAFDAACRALLTSAEFAPRKLGEVDGLEEACDALLRLRAMLTQQQAHADHARMVRLARALLAEYATLKRQRGLVDMTDLERAALVLLGDAELAGWLQERLDLRLRHLLIDEFQDTSPLQWHALQGWLSAYAGAGGGASGQRPPAVFIVGDPKQSIYRFRRAEPRVFEAAKDFVLQGLDGTVLACDHTRRNAPALIQALNTAFGDAAGSDGWQGFRAHTTASLSVGGLHRLPDVLRSTQPASATELQRWRPSLTEAKSEPEEQLRMQEARGVASAVAALLVEQGLGAGEVMVLARQRSSLRLVAQALAERHLPCVMPEALALSESPEALDLIALLDVLASPGHDISLARALKSPIFGASDDELLWLAQRARQADESWLAALLAAPEPPGTELPRAQRLLRSWAADVAKSAPHDLIDRIVHEGDLMPRLAATVPAARQALAAQAVQALLAASIDEQRGRYLTLYALVRALRSGLVRVPMPAPADAVQLLTVHGAKGLEANVVFLVDTDPHPRPADSAALLIDWPVHLAAPRRVAFVARESAAPASLLALLEEERGARQREELNALYVAMTRSRQWLLVSRTEPHRSGEGRSWWQRLQGLASAWRPQDGAAALDTGQPVAQVAVLPALRRQHARSERPAVQDPHRARIGQAVHRLLEWLGRPGAPVPAAERPAMAAAAAAACGVAPAAVPEVLGAAALVLASADCQRFFVGPGLRWAGNEIVVAAQGQVLRIDRLVQIEHATGMQWWVLDYKLGDAPERIAVNREQLARYREAVQALVPGETVRAAFITRGGILLEL